MSLLKKHLRDTEQILIVLQVVQLDGTCASWRDDGQVKREISLFKRDS